MAHKSDDVRGHARLYLAVFGALLVATVLTVMAAQVHLIIGLAVFVAIVIAAVKASLVAAFFMHLKGESGEIYRVLIITAIFLVALFVLPLLGLFSTTQRGNHLWSTPPTAAATPHAPQP